jgi:glycosyltransferase involved in cell wall biosynthesis
MKITIVQGVGLPVPPLLGGAVEKAWYALGAQFARMGHVVTHISRAYAGLPRQQMLNGVRHVRVGGFDLPSSTLTLRLYDLIYSLRASRILPRADVLVTNTTWLPILVRTASHGALYVHVGRFPKGQIGLYRHAARLQAPSLAVRDAIIAESPGCASRVSIVPYPLTRHVEPMDALTWASGRDETVLFAGRIHREKGIHLLLEAFENLVADGLTEWKLWIVGPWARSQGGGGRAYCDALRHASRRLGGQVRWFDPVFDERELWARYRAARIFVYPSLAERGESFGLAALEAMASGCAVVVSDLACFRDFVRDGVNGAVFDHRGPNPAAALTERVRRLLAEPSQLAEHGARASWTAQRFELPEVARQYLIDFQDAVQGRPSRFVNAETDEFAQPLGPGPYAQTQES